MGRQIGWMYLHNQQLRLVLEFLAQVVLYGSTEKVSTFVKLALNVNELKNSL